MENVVLPPWAAKAVTLWTTIGTILVLVGTKIVGLPEWAPALFSDTTVQIILTAVGTFIGVIQYFRTKVFAKKSTEIQALSAGNKAAYYFIPWKMEV